MVEFKLKPCSWCYEFLSIRWHASARGLNYKGKSEGESHLAASFYLLPWSFPLATSPALGTQGVRGLSPSGEGAPQAALQEGAIWDNRRTSNSLSPKWETRSQDEPDPQPGRGEPQGVCLGAPPVSCPKAKAGWDGAWLRAAPALLHPAWVRDPRTCASRRRLHEQRQQQQEQVLEVAPQTARGAHDRGAGSHWLQLLCPTRLSWAHGAPRGPAPHQQPRRATCGAPCTRAASAAAEAEALHL